LKTCIKCGFSKSLEGFVKNPSCSDGRAGWCLSCFSRYMGSRVRAKQLILDEIKSKPCSDCGLSFAPYCMDLDHVRGFKVKDVSKLLTSRNDRFMSEVEKCDVVCACCHRIRSSTQITSTKIPRLQKFHIKLNLLKSKPCVDCSGIFAPVAMDFDHVRGIKFRMVSTMVNYSWRRVLDEIVKCDLVCANCHRIRTKFRKSLAEAA
jgi:hypothetical protein